MTNITKEDLIRYFRGETSREKRDKISEAIRKDSELNDAYFLLTRVKQPLLKSEVAPPEQIIQKLLKYGVKRQRDVSK